MRKTAWFGSFRGGLQSKDKSIAPDAQTEHPGDGRSVRVKPGG
jgi:hypothetical protein